MKSIHNLILSNTVCGWCFYTIGHPWWSNTFWSCLTGGHCTRDSDTVAFVEHGNQCGQVLLEPKVPICTEAKIIILQHQCINPLWTSVFQGHTALNKAVTSTGLNKLEALVCVLSGTNHVTHNGLWPHKFAQTRTYRQTSTTPCQTHNQQYHLIHDHSQQQIS